MYPDPHTSTQDYDPARYGDGCASFYSDIYPRAEPALVALIQALAGPGPTLELGVANGRTAIALKAAGVDIHGIDASPAMLACFRDQPGAAGIPVMLGDFSSAPLGGPYSLVFAICSTLNLLPSPERIAHCLSNIRAHLKIGGLLLSEAWNAPPTTCRENTAVPVRTALGIRQYRAELLVLPLAELDALASSCNLHLEARWSSPSRTPWTPDQPRHLSLYRRR